MTLGEMFKKYNRFAEESGFVTQIVAHPVTQAEEVERQLLPKDLAVEAEQGDRSDLWLEVTEGDVNEMNRRLMESQWQTQLAQTQGTSKQQMAGMQLQ